jgi:DNA-binding GntR family transcriptional regulator
MNETIALNALSEPAGQKPMSASPKPSLVASVAQQLRDMIAQNLLAPGDRIREQALAERLAVSRTPLREALRILAAERLIELLPNRGAIVAALSMKEVEDLLSVLGQLEALAGEQAALNGTDAEIAEIKALHYEMLATFERGDRLAYFKLNQAIHRAIVAASQNGALAELHDQLNARLYRIRYQSNLANENWRKAIREHGAILDALERRAASELARILRAHLGSTWSNISGRDQG